jgi:hypothetical protein
VEELKRLKDQYEQTLAQVQPKLQSAPNPSLSPAGVAAGGARLRPAADGICGSVRDYQHALQQANDWARRPMPAALKIEAPQQEYEQAFAQPAEASG